MLRCSAASRHLARADRDVPAHGTGWEQPLTRAMSYAVLMVSSPAPEEDGSGLPRLLGTQGRRAGCRYLVSGVCQQAVERRAAHASPPWVLRARFCFPGEKRLEGVETTRDAVKTTWLLEVGMFCGDIGNPSGREALSDGGVKRHLPPSASAQQPPGVGGSDPAAGSRQPTPPSALCSGPAAPFPAGREVKLVDASLGL